MHRPTWPRRVKRLCLLQYSSPAPSPQAARPYIPLDREDTYMEEVSPSLQALAPGQTAHSAPPGPAIPAAAAAAAYSLNPTPSIEVDITTEAREAEAEPEAAHAAQAGAGEPLLAAAPAPVDQAEAGGAEGACPEEAAPPPSLEDKLLSHFLDAKARRRPGPPRSTLAARAGSAEHVVGCWQRALF